MQKMQTWQKCRNFSTQEHGSVGKIGGTGGIGGVGGVRIMEKGVSSVFYADVLRAYVNLTGVLRFWAICNLVLRHAREQLDPQRQGVAITIARCMPPYQGKKIRSMYECMQVTTAAWENRRDDQLLFLGAESLAGYAVSMGRPAAIQNLIQNNSTATTSPTATSTDPMQAREQSLVAYPVMRSGCIAGCLLAASTQPEYFLTMERLQLLQHHAELAALAFEPEEFYPSERIELCIMPSLEVQHLYLASLQQRISHIMADTVVNQRPLNSLEAERLAWQQLEEELFQRPFSFEE